VQRRDKRVLRFLDLTSPVTNADVIVFSGAGHVFDVSLRFFFCSRCQERGFSDYPCSSKTSQKFANLFLSEIPD